MSDDELKSWSKNDLVREVRKLRHLMAEQMNAGPGVGESVEVNGACTLEGKPFVAVVSGEASWQWSPSEARMHAFIVLEKAVECERDAAVIAFLRETVELDDEAAGGFLMQLREHRADWLKHYAEGSGS